MPRAKFIGYIAILLSLSLAFIYGYHAFYSEYDKLSINLDIRSIALLSNGAYYAIAAPIALTFLGIMGTGFWVGWTILTIKVVPPMPEIVEKKDFSKLKALLLCLVTLGLSALFVYGLVIKNFWALAIPSAAITLIVLGAIFWVGIAIITTRATLPTDGDET